MAARDKFAGWPCYCGSHHPFAITKVPSLNCRLERIGSVGPVRSVERRRPGADLPVAVVSSLRPRKKSNVRTSPRSFWTYRPPQDGAFFHERGGATIKRLVPSAGPVPWPRQPRRGAMFPVFFRNPGRYFFRAPSIRDCSGAAMQRAGSICSWGHTRRSSADKVRTPPPGTHNRQIPAQHIKELRQAVDARPAKKRAYSSGGRVIVEP